MHLYYHKKKKNPVDGKCKFIFSDTGRSKVIKKPAVLSVGYSQKSSSCSGGGKSISLTGLNDFL
jgi:hypothetical protein